MVISQDNRFFTNSVSLYRLCMYMYMCASDTKSLVRGMTNPINLDSLDLAGNHLGVAGLKAFLEASHLFPYLRDLRVDCHGNILIKLLRLLLKCLKKGYWKSLLKFQIDCRHGGEALEAKQADLVQECLAVSPWLHLHVTWPQEGVRSIYYSDSDSSRSSDDDDDDDDDGSNGMFGVDDFDSDDDPSIVLHEFQTDDSEDGEGWDEDEDEEEDDDENVGIYPLEYHSGDEGYDDDDDDDDSVFWHVESSDVDDTDDDDDDDL